MFVPQLPYLPLGDLRAVASYPNDEGIVDDREIQQALDQCRPPHLAIRLNDVGDWGKVLSVGEQQRIAFARILLSKPRAVFLDESTSATGRGPRADALRTDSRRAPGDHSGQRESPRDSAALPRAPSGAGRRGEWRLEPLATPVEASAALARACRGTLPGWRGMFDPTLDWGNELLASLEWIAKAWAIAARRHAADLVLIARYTVWGRQFWRITGAYFKGPESVKVWLWLAALLLSVIIGRAAHRAPQLPGQRHDDELPGRGRRASAAATTPSRTPARTASGCR